MFLAALLLIVSGFAGWTAPSHCVEMNKTAMPHQGGMADQDSQLCCAGHCLPSLPVTLNGVVLLRAIEPQVAAPSDLTTSQHWPPPLRPPRFS
jgi:hypothetical protein